MSPNLLSPVFLRHINSSSYTSKGERHVRKKGCGFNKSEKSLWDLAIENADVEKESSQTSEDAAVFVIGSKNCGKTSLILRFLERDEAPKSTVALEYTFGRRAKGHNIAKDVGHIWELGGGTWLSKLMDIPLNPDTLKHTTLVIMVDLSLPNVMWYTLETLLAAAKSRLEHVIAERKPSDPDIREKLRTQGWERLNGDHMDKVIIEPFPIPLVIIGGKYDLFQNFDSEKRKIICKTLRFVAHVHGAHLQFFSSKQDQLVSKSRALVSHYLFGTAASKTLQTDHNKPLFVPPGADAISNIGNPPLPSEDLGRVHARSPLELWKISFSHYFPAETHNNPSVKEDPAKDPQYKEAAVDSLRVQKDEELERYRRISERRGRDFGQQSNEAF